MYSGEKGIYWPTRRHLISDLYIKEKWKCSLLFVFLGKKILFETLYPLKHSLLKDFSSAFDLFQTKTGEAPTENPAPATEQSSAE